MFEGICFTWILVIYFEIKILKSSTGFFRSCLNNWIFLRRHRGIESMNQSICMLHLIRTHHSHGNARVLHVASEWRLPLAMFSMAFIDYLHDAALLVIAGPSISNADGFSIPSQKQCILWRCCRICHSLACFWNRDDITRIVFAKIY